MRYYPMMVNLQGKPCIVVGGGNVAERKIRTLLSAGAEITVISPNCTTAIRQWAGGGKLFWVQREFESQDIEEAVIVIAATNNSSVNLKVYHSLKSNQWINIADRPDLCNFIVPATLDRGDLQIAISTGGKSPGLAQKLKKKLDKLLEPEYENYLSFLGDMRSQILSTPLNPSQKKELLHQLMEESFWECTVQKRWTERDERAQQLIAAFVKKSE